ncbi:MAG: hypothetical protein SCH71_06535 [Desulfobulbaceae bacterium]|nr:hypothetical protein [Desulfobulbaceae bacterium]
MSETELLTLAIEALIELLPPVISLFIGACTGLAFVSASKMRWF